MFTKLYWIDGPWRGRLAISSRPRGGDWLEDEIKNWRSNGLDTVVSLLTPEEMKDLGLQNEEHCCWANGIQFLSFPIIDRSVPSSDSDTVRLLQRLETDLDQGKSISVHCRQGIGRSGLIAVGLLAGRGLSPADAIERVSKARHAMVPETEGQRTWINSFAATLNTLLLKSAHVSQNDKFD